MINGLMRIMPDKFYLKLRYCYFLKKRLNLKNPKTFNEKINWLKLYDRNPFYTKLVDKYEVKSYVEDVIGKEHIIRTLGLYNRFDDIPFDSLPNRFVIKCTHDSGGLVIVENKEELDMFSAKAKITKSLENNYYYHGREWPYKNVKPRIIVEEYMADGADELTDYKVMCFNGVAKIIFTCTERFGDGLKVTFFDTDWNRLPFTRHYPSSKKKIEKPKKLKEMLRLSEKLSSGIPFVRVDWYEIGGELFFGEYTFYPGNGLEEFDPEEWDYKLGEMMDLSGIEKGKGAR